MAPITCGTFKRGKGRKRRKKSDYNSGLLSGYGFKGRFRTLSGDVCPLNHSDSGNNSAGFNANAVDHAVSRYCFECNCRCVSDTSDAVLLCCDISNLVDAHSAAAISSPCVKVATIQPTTISRTTHVPFRSQRDLFSLLTLLIASQVLVTTTHTTHAAYTAPEPPPYLTSSSLRSNTRYKLLPVSKNSDSIFIYFNPPSIHNLRINTRQSVYFNFTLHPRNPRRGFVDEKINNSALDSGNNSVSNHESSPQGDENGGVSMTTTSNSPASNQSQSASFSTPNTSSTFVSHSTNQTFNQSKSSKNDNQTNSYAALYWVMIFSNDDSIARPVIISPNGHAVAHADAKGSYILMAVWAGRLHNFSVEARHIGRATMSVAVVDVQGDRRMPQASYVQAVAASQYPVTAIRGERTADLVFNISAAAIAIIISFGMGGVTDTDSLKRQIKHPVPLIIGFCCQFIILPVMAFSLAIMLPLENEILFGLLCVACVPGGGISHVAVVIADGDTALSLTMNFINVVAMLGTAPLWIFVLGQYFQANAHTVLSPRTIPIFRFEIWFVSIFVAYAAGLTIKRLRPSIADAILMWIIKPFLLLACILYITLGVYINMYVFELVNGYALMGAILLPVSGCMLGGILAVICRQTYNCIKTLALEASSLNCLIVMVALRFSLRQPDADLAAVIPIWVMFTIPGFFVFLAICNKVKNILLHFWRNRNNKDNDALASSKTYSVSSSVVSPPGTTTLSAPLVASDCLEDDATISTTSNQKVTVL